MNKILLFSLVLISSFGFGQEPVIEWDKSLGGSGSDIAVAIQQTTDGGYIVGGSSDSNDGNVTENNGSKDYWIVKLDASGDIIWQKSLGGSDDDYLNSIQQTTDGGYIVVGTSTSTDGDVTGNNDFYDYWVVKLDASGNITWEKSLGGSQFDFGRSVQQTTDGGYIVAGDAKSNDGNVTVNNDFNKIWVVKLDASGNITWQSSFGGWSNDHGYSIQQTTNGGYIVAGDSESDSQDVTGNNGGRDCWIVRLDTIGNIVWQKSLGGSGFDVATSIQQTTNGGYVFTGSSESNDGDLTENNGDRDAWIVKLDSAGNITWQKSLGGSGKDYASSIIQSSDGGYIVAGSSESNDGDVTVNNGDFDSWVVKLDASGNITWEKSLGGSRTEYARSIRQTTDGGYVVAGASDSNNGDVTSSNVYTNYWIVKLSPETSSINEFKALKLNLYPNPSTDIFTISSEKLINSSFKIIDVQGKEVQSGTMNGKEQTVDVSNLSKGVYSIVFDDLELPVLSVIKE